MGRKLKRQTEYTAAARKKIHERDREMCVFCAMGYAMPEDLSATRSALQIMHIVPRSQLGKGVEENGALGCVWHHNMLDNGNAGNRREMLAILEERMRYFYPGWSRAKVTYRKTWVEPEAAKRQQERNGALPKGSKTEENAAERSRSGDVPEGFWFLREEENRCESW